MEIVFTNNDFVKYALGYIMNALLRCLDCNLLYCADSWICPRCYEKQNNKIDIRKLISLLYVINESKYISKNEKYYLSIFSDVIVRNPDNFLPCLQRYGTAMYKKRCRF